MDSDNPHALLRALARAVRANDRKAIKPLASKLRGWCDIYAYHTGNLRTGILFEALAGEPPTCGECGSREECKAHADCYCQCPTEDCADSDD